jgi:glucose/arabinose dehydrogenase
MRKVYGIVGTLAVGAAIWAGGAIAQNNQNHESVGQHFQFMASNLPPPFATPASAERSTKSEDPDLGKLQLPPGFKANLFADGLSNARWLQMAPNGDVMLAEAEAGKITLLRDSNGDGKADMRVTFADGFQHPHGMAFATG